ncbi:hypothetical protein NLI96_g877 [Meripilus lineatus]|uniref:Protein kinase domain-containing protein n=1 Tax=Meripilus lineatus TaxID=2056292 RepID=A0AAD5VFS7_9APHY|nr:hypothetical protein NLI96_g877 [Physisporinus lineatus]
MDSAPTDTVDQPPPSLSTSVNSNQLAQLLASLHVTPRRNNSTRSAPITQDAQEEHKQNAEGMEFQYVFMKIAEFLTIFAPGPSHDPELEELLANLPEITITADDLKRPERLLYCKLKQEIGLSIGNRLFAGTSADVPSGGSSTSTKPSPNVRVDIAIFDSGSEQVEDENADESKNERNDEDSSEERDDEDSWEDEDDDDEYQEGQRGVKSKGTPSAWDKIVVPIEVKNANRASPFKQVKDGCPYPESGTADGEANRGQITTYTGRVFENQSRTHVYAIYIDGESVYLIRWDRAGAIVSEPFSLLRERDKLHTFLFRLGKMTPTQQGYDDSVRPALPSEAKEFLGLTTKNAIHQEYLNEARAVHQGTKAAIFATDIKGWGDHPDLRLVFGRPRVIGGGIVGRATRGYVAYDTISKQIVFLKDYWQPETEKYHKELDTYAKLIAAGVRHIATPLGGGSVCDDPTSPHRTLTQSYLSKAHGCSYSARDHYRIVLKEVGRPLEDYRDAKGMVLAVYCAFKAHEGAWKAKVLHRDISSGNILILDNGEGILNDWDMCKHVEEEKDATSPAFRSGTWPFMSALLLQFPRKPHQLSDDLESFVHVINWLIVRFHIQWSPGFIEGAMLPYKEYERTLDGDDIGGRTKLNQMRTGHPNFSPDEVDPPKLGQLAHALMKICKEHYSSPEVMALLKRSAAKSKPKKEGLSNNPVSFTSFIEKPKPNARVAEQLLEPVREGEPLLKDHTRLSDAMDLFIWPLEEAWGGTKLEDQFLQRPNKLNCGSGAGGSAKLLQSAGRSRLSRHSHQVDDLEEQPPSKKVKRSHGGGAKNRRGKRKRRYA